MAELKFLSITAVFAPLLGLLLALLAPSKRWIAILSSVAIAISVLASILLLDALVAGRLEAANFTLYNWATIASYNLQLGFIVDKLSALMLVVVSSVSLVVHVYSYGYMQDDPGFRRFFCYISLFTTVMLLLVTASNYLQLFIAWEGVGLVSYLLIGFWYTKASANSAALKAFWFNRIGDIAFVLGIALLIVTSGSFDYATSLNLVAKQALPLNTIQLAAGLLFIGAMAKSAQVPLHSWLPDSMEGPTPISALIHAATMVTAGIYMVARLFPLFAASTEVLQYVMLIGSVTALSMAILACVQQDIKRVIAYSTLSQLGYMVASFGSGVAELAVFHLITHAFFKALLFLAAGCVIVAMHHEQNIWKMGALAKRLPVTAILTLIGIVALVGLPGTSGFYSKDLIIEAIAGSNRGLAKPCYYMLLSAVFFTSFYSFRMFFLVFYNSNKDNLPQAGQPEVVMLAPLSLLAIPAIVAGVYAIPYLQPVLVKLDFINSTDKYPALSIFLHGLKAWPTLLLALGLIAAALMYYKPSKLPEILSCRLAWVKAVLNYKYGFDMLHERIICPLTLTIAKFANKIIDALIIDRLGVLGTAKIVMQLATRCRALQTGLLFNYILYFVIGILGLFIWLYLQVKV